MHERDLSGSIESPDIFQCPAEPYRRRRRVGFARRAAISIDRRLAYREPAQLRLTEMKWHGNIHFEDCFLRYTGPTGDNSVHNHLVVQLVLSAAATVELRHGVRLTGTALYIRPNIAHRLLPCERAEVFLVEPHSAFGRALLNWLPSKEAGVLENADQLISSCMSTLIPAAIDSRLSAIMTDLSGPGALQRSISEVSLSNGLSPQRLRALSRQELGMPMGKWRLWAALRKASDSLANGASIADAAYDGGFSDQPHFTRTMRSTLGLTPQMIRPALEARP